MTLTQELFYYYGISSFGIQIGLIMFCYIQYKKAEAKEIAYKLARTQTKDNKNE